MQWAGLHEDTVLSPLPTGSPLRDVDTVVGMASVIDGLGAELEAATVRLAQLVRDGASDALPNESAREVLAAAGRVHHSAQVAAAIGLAQVEVTNAHLDDAVRSAPAWAEQHAGFSGGSVAELRRVNRTMSRYPQLAGAFVDGRLRSSQLVAVDKIIPKRFREEALTEAVELLSECQSALLFAADSALTAKEFQRFCAKVRDRIDTDGPQPETPGADDSEVRLRQRRDGRWDLIGDLNATDGAVLATQIEERDQRNLRARQDDPELKGVRDDRTVDARFAAAMMQLVTAGAADGRPGRVGLFLHIDLADLARRGAHMPEPMAHTEANYDITVDSLWDLLADADVVPVITDSGTPLSYGRTRRLAPAILKHVLAHRDRECFVPGCDAPPQRQHSHHVEHWEHGGTTDPWNNKGGCSFHHHLHHDGKWGVAMPPGRTRGKAIITRPDGTPFDPTPEWRRRNRARTRERMIERVDAALTAARNQHH